MKTNKRNRQSGFSLIELLVVVLVMSIITGVVMRAISDVQKQAQTEETKLDEFQTAREFMDQMVRDVHQSGFPNQKMYQPNTFGANYQQDQHISVGLVSISPTSIHFEGDVDGNGVVDEVFYTLVPQNSGPGTQNCPCIQRSAQAKAPVTDPTAQVPLYTTQVENVVAGGTPIFTYYKQDGTPALVGNGSPYTRANWNTQAPCDNSPIAEPMNCIWSVQIRLNVRSAVTDLGTGRRLQAVLTAGAQVNN